MVKVLNIACVSENHANSHKSQGSIMLYDNNWCEGVVKVTGTYNSYEKLIFGVYYPLKGMELIEIPIYDSSLPLDYSTRYNGIYYEGSTYQMNETRGDFLYGSCTIKVTKSLTSVATVKKEIAAFVKSMNPALEDIYKNTYDMREAIASTIIGSNEKKKINQKKKICNFK